MDFFCTTITHLGFKSQYDSGIITHSIARNRQTPARLSFNACLLLTCIVTHLKKELDLVSHHELNQLLSRY